MNNVSPQGGAGAVDDPKKLRSGYWVSIAETCKHVRTSIQSEGKRLRTTDYVSIILLPVFALLLAVFAANIMLTTYRPFFAVAFFIALLYFIGARIGVLRALTPRQTHLTFNVIIATFMLGCTFALLVFEVIRLLP
jgi:uncharacterized membrane protein